ncbi:unnamed protein product [Urochloa decumbens]|uniref:Uncharacterized protein n=1 Tax=Urochloa decumbens TaxID=240449 RepID=A0ABC9C3E4_9POAL
MEQLREMLDAGFAAGCVSSFFCSTCRTAVCHNCCGQDHLARHHNGDGQIVEVTLIRNGVPAVPARAVKSRRLLGYDWRGIQRIYYQGEDWVPILRQPEPDRRSKERCRCCRDPCKKDYCCAACKRTTVTSGQARDLIEALAHTDFARARIRDRYCLVCARAFSSVHCPNHANHHHGGHGVGAGDVVEIHYGDGWFLVREDSLPEQWLDGIMVQRIDWGGQRMVPVQRRMLAVPGGPNQCLAASCEESVQNPGEACSIRCLVI